jgi:hypothetical protein
MCGCAPLCLSVFVRMCAYACVPMRACMCVCPLGMCGCVSKHACVSACAYTCMCLLCELMRACLDMRACAPTRACVRAKRWVPKHVRVAQRARMRWLLSACMRASCLSVFVRACVCAYAGVCAYAACVLTRPCVQNVCVRSCVRACVRG